ncbi:unnamed protein product [Soboliphyme baturini]|uniref:DUF805 domain-containing protein n=1 Tax=Soboliphyme baturini TaxID=241478 RepID=A0A183J171_9BILA|nr:unnamed protein product [Soboliphyme baturini]
MGEDLADVQPRTPWQSIRGISRLFAIGARLWLLFGFVIGFGSLITSIWILFADFVDKGVSNQWRGVSLFLQNFLIFVASLVYKFGRTEEVWG